MILLSNLPKIKLSQLDGKIDFYDINKYKNTNSKHFNEIKFFLFEIISNAKVSNELPAKTAVASPNFLCVDGFPLLIRSLSIHGRSSCISE